VGPITSTIFTAPPGAASGQFYVTGHTEKPVTGPTHLNGLVSLRMDADDHTQHAAEMKLMRFATVMLTTRQATATTRASMRSDVGT